MFAIWWLIDEVRISVEKVWYCTSTFVKLVGGRIIEVEGQSGIFICTMEIGTEKKGQPIEPSPSPPTSFGLSISRGPSLSESHVYPLLDAISPWSRPTS